MFGLAVQILPQALIRLKSPVTRSPLNHEPLHVPSSILTAERLENVRLEVRLRLTGEMWVIRVSCKDSIIQCG